MNFILCLSHFCDSHGPTSIICTTITPPTCQICYGTSSAESSSSSNSSCHSVEREETAEDDDRNANTTLNTPIRLPSTPEPEASRPATANPPLSPNPGPSKTTKTVTIREDGDGGGGGGAGSNKTGGDGVKGTSTRNTSDATSREPSSQGRSHLGPSSSTTALSSPVDTPPASPTPASILTSSSLPTNLPPHHNTHIPIAPTSTSQSSSCPNCALTLPKSITAKLAPSTSPTLRSKEYLWIHPPPPPPAPSAPSSLSTLTALPTNPPGHTHTLLYKSTHQPQTQHLYSILRRSYIRALSCEVSPTPTQPTSIFFGDKKAGYTIAYIFQILDAKARGGKRTYAFLCVSDDERKLLESWRFVVSSFKTLVARIASLATSTGTGVGVGLGSASPSGTVTPVSANRDIINPNPNKSALGLSGMSGIGKSGGIEGFLRRGGHATEARGLSDLVGKEEIFVEVHAGFVGILAGLGRRFGFDGGWGTGDWGPVAGVVGAAAK